MTEFESILNHLEKTRDSLRTDIENLLYNIEEIDDEETKTILITELLDKSEIRMSIDSMDIGSCSFLVNRKTYKLYSSFVGIPDKTILAIKETRQIVTDHILFILEAGEVYDTELAQTIALSQELDNLILRLVNARMPQEISEQELAEIPEEEFNEEEVVE